MSELRMILALLSHFVTQVLPNSASVQHRWLENRVHTGSAQGR